MEIVNNEKGKEKEKKTKIKYEEPKRKPNIAEKKQMLGKAVEIAVRVVMSNHVYKFNGVTRKQSEGGAIGLRLTGAVALCVMVWWDRQLSMKLTVLKIELDLYKRFVDDTGVMTDEIEKGTIINGNELIICEEKKKEDENKSSEEVTAEIVKEVAESITDMIKLTIEVPGKFPDKKLPILDIKMWINYEEGNRIDFEFYSKSISNPLVIMKRSAMSDQSKRTILTQECLRRLRNTKKELGEEVQNKHLSEYMSRMRKSGYSAIFRLQILKSAKEAYKKMLIEDKEGTKPLYRSRSWNREERNNLKRNKKKNWYKSKSSKGTEYNSVLFV